MNQCLVCGESAFERLVSEADLEQECRERENFVHRRLRRPASPDELKDLTDFYHQSHANLDRCCQCSLLIRRESEPEPVANYSEDEYNPSVIERQFPRYAEAFREKAEPYQTLLPRSANIVEVGSHYGAFLQVAGEWGWHAEGVDVGEDTTRFAREKGFSVFHGELSERRYASASLDAVFIWNCFEQIADPKPLLQETRRITKPDGLLVIRVPNGSFYVAARTRKDDELIFDGLGYNNLLGFPYLYGYSPLTLKRITEAAGFRLQLTIPSRLLVFPLPDTPAWIAAEHAVVDDQLTATGPWIEQVFSRNNSD